MDDKLDLILARLSSVEAMLGKLIEALAEEEDDKPMMTLEGGYAGRARDEGEPL